MTHFHILGSNVKLQGKFNLKTYESMFEYDSQQSGPYTTAEVFMGTQPARTLVTSFFYIKLSRLHPFSISWRLTQTWKAYPLIRTMACLLKDVRQRSSRILHTLRGAIANKSKTALFNGLQSDLTMCMKMWVRRLTVGNVTTSSPGWGVWTRTSKGSTTALSHKY